jgi:hypothetical protein
VGLHPDPGRFEEPGPPRWPLHNRAHPARRFPATDHAAQRARRGRGRHRIRRRVHRQCGEGGGALGSLIPHASAVRALVIAMIESAFRAPAMPLPRRAEGRVTCRAAARWRAIGVTAITRRADGEGAIAASADFLAKRRVHDVEAAARFDWTRRTNRGTRETTGSVRRSIEAVTEGLELLPPGSHLDPPQGRQTISNHPVTSRGRSAAAASERWCPHDGRRAPAGPFDDR